MPQGLYSRLPCIQYKIVIYTAAVFHDKKFIYTAAVHPVKSVIYTAAVFHSKVFFFSTAVPPVRNGYVHGRLAKHVNMSSRNETYYPLIWRLLFGFSARVATNSVFVVIFISFCKINIDCVQIDVAVFHSKRVVVFFSAAVPPVRNGYVHGRLAKHVNMFSRDETYYPLI